jgi:hypothetical protein
MERSLNETARRGAELALLAVPVALATALAAIVDRYIPRGPALDVLSSRPVWDILMGDIHRFAPIVIGLLLIMAILKSMIGCWFIRTAFYIRGGDQDEKGMWPFVRYFVRYLPLQVSTYALFSFFGLLVVFACSTIIYPAFPIVEKVAILLVFAVSFPVFVMVLAFTRYWAYCKQSYSTIFRAVIGSFRSHGRRAYFFFFVASVLGISFGVLLPLAILRLPFPYPVGLIVVALVATAVIMWIRGWYFEFQHALFWDSEDRRFRF